jgi:hypothetical protein
MNHTVNAPIIALLTRIYEELLVIEGKFGLMVGDGDMRQRIDYFHDAVRAFSSDNSALQQQRLSVELLEYDLRCLRYIQKMPLSPFKKNGESLSPNQSLIAVNAGLPTMSNSPDRDTRSRLVELYQNYSVLFAALLKPAADRDFFARTEEYNEEVQEIIAIIQQMEAKGKPEIIANLKAQIKQKDANIKSIDKAHLSFAMNQLGIFEDSKDLLKKLATQGTNLIGKFVENAITETRRQMGR